MPTEGHPGQLSVWGHPQLMLAGQQQADSLSRKERLQQKPVFGQNPYC